jgi:hypothetical protein
MSMNMCAGGADGWHPLEEPLMCGEVDDAMAGLGDVPGTRDVVRWVDVELRHTQPRRIP